jgi:leucyl-tRNA synthetase
MIHETIRDVTTDISVTHAFNTAIARLMRFSNVLNELLFTATSKDETQSHESLSLSNYSPSYQEKHMMEEEKVSIKLQSTTIPNLAILHSDIYLFGLKTLLLLLAPMAPHFACEVWHNLVNSGQQEIDIKSSVLAQPWPTVDPTALQYDTVELVIQVRIMSK